MSTSTSTSQAAPAPESQEQYGPVSDTKTSPPLQSSLHAANLSIHMSLNKSILARLPLCLPPHASDPTAYYIGILVYGQIYVAFESAMAHILNCNTYSERDQDVIRRLQVSGLARSEKLKHDLELLAKRLKLPPSYADIGKGTNTEIFEAVRGAAKQYTSHISRNITEKPYLAMAYAWTMYLAMFNGGRYLLRVLAAAGSDFWLENMDAEQQETSQEVEALSFWKFDAATHADPEANKLKFEFKTRFDEASELLNDTERAEVVQEAKTIFETCVNMITFLDEYMADQKDQLEAVAQQAAAGEVSSSWFGQAATSMWQGLASRLATLNVPSWSTSLRNEVEVME